MPSFYNSVYKTRARLENIKLYRKITGFKSIPVSRTYWTMCNLQPLCPSSEIVQVVSEKLLCPSQFVGVDYDKEIIAQNKKWHPESVWIDTDWVTAIKTRPFNPSFVYLDTTSFADHDNAISLLTHTMLSCMSKTIVFANFMMNDPRSKRKFKIETLISALGKEIPSRELKKWNSQIVNYEYSMTGKTEMGTFVLVKE